MPNGNTTPSRAGQINSTGGSFANDNALFLKKFAGEILTTFEENNIFKGLHTVRTIDSGKSAQFPVTGVATASYHTPGQNIADAGNSYLSDPKKNEKVITIDDVLLASTFLASIDDVKNHYDIRSVYSTELGRALANRFDSALAKVFIAAARTTTPNVTGGNVGGEIDVSQNLLRAPAGAGADGDTTDPTGAELIAALFTAAAALDNNDVPADGRFCVLRPQEYYKLITGGDGSLVVNTSASNKDVGGSGSLASGSIAQVAGIDIYKSTHVPSTDMTSATGTNSGDEGASNDVFAATDGYDGDFSNTCGIVAHPSAVGTVKLLDLATESEYQISRQGTLFVAKYAMGHGVLRPECCIELHK
tara:strand:+ start:3545 stop:4627 length:1083 start_codon:yes stop_codon:yes gene_type:complete